MEAAYSDQTNLNHRTSVNFRDFKARVRDATDAVPSRSKL